MVKRKQKKQNKAMATTTAPLKFSALLLLPHSSSSSNSSTFLHPLNIPINRTSLGLKSFTPLNPQTQTRRNFIRRRSSAVDEAPVLEAPPPPPPPPPSTLSVPELKFKLLSTVCGLNKGLAANVEDMTKADAVAKELEAAGGLVDLSVDLDKLQGKWKLVYSSAFSSRTLGGSRPGLPTGRLLPITLGQVFQRIDIFSKDFDNIVELELGAPWPLPPVELTATLAHKFELTGSAKVKITFEKTSVKTTGNLSQLPPLEVPKLPDALRPPSNPGSGEFEVTYLDADTRITRGDREELRVFVIA